MTTPAAPSRAGALPLVGGALALDFCNTESDRGGPQHQDHLRHTEHLQAWAAHVGLEGGALPAEALPRARALRAAIHAAFAALARAAAPPEPALAGITAELAACLARARLAPAGTALAWQWDAAAEPVAALLGPVALSAARLLTAEPDGRLRQCAGAHCGWLFRDSTRNGGRRWCEMEVCGNRAKQRRKRGKQESSFS